MAHVSLITLGVSNLARATEFYERLGWERSTALDGHLWEVAHNPGFELRGDGGVVLPG